MPAPSVGAVGEASGQLLGADRDDALVVLADVLEQGDAGELRDDVDRVGGAGVPVGAHLLRWSFWYSTVLLPSCSIH